MLIRWSCFDHKWQTHHSLRVCSSYFVVLSFPCGWGMLFAILVFALPCGWGVLFAILDWWYSFWCCGLFNPIVRSLSSFSYIWYWSWYCLSWTILFCVGTVTIPCSMDSSGTLFLMTSMSYSLSLLEENARKFFIITLQLHCSNMSNDCSFKTGHNISHSILI